LIESLDPHTDDDVAAAWEAEIARRVSEIDNGEITLIPWEEVRRRMNGEGLAALKSLHWHTRNASPVIGETDNGHPSRD